MKSQSAHWRGVKCVLWIHTLLCILGLLVLRPSAILLSSVFALDLPVVAVLCSILLVIEIISKMLCEFPDRKYVQEGGCELLGIIKKRTASIIFLSSNFYDLFMVYFDSCFFLFIIYLLLLLLFYSIQVIW